MVPQVDAKASDATRHRVEQLHSTIDERVGDAADVIQQEVLRVGAEAVASSGGKPGVEIDCGRLGDHEETNWSGQVSEVDTGEFQVVLELCWMECGA